MGALDRRQFLQVVALGTAGFAIGCTRDDTTLPSGAADAAATLHDFNAFVRIGSDNIVTVVVKHLDKGQGVSTGLPTIVAEELDADWAQMRFEFAPVDTERYRNFAFGSQGTGGSTSVANSWDQLRTAAAGARAMLVEAAAARWGVPADGIEIDKGVLSHAGGKHSARFGELAAAASVVAPPQAPGLKDPSEYRLIGTHVPRLDTDAKTDGSATFTLDVVRPNQCVALVAHAPKFGARVRSFDATGANAVKGVLEVVQIPSGIAVLADSFHSALKGRSALQIDWDDSTAETRSSDALFAEHHRLLDEAGVVARNDGDAAAELASGDTIEMTFEFPYLAHAAMEPLDCVVELSAGRCEIWTGCQSPSADQRTTAAITGLPAEKIFINTLYAGGSFGRRASTRSDFVAEAVEIAKAIDGRRVVKLQWTREDDMRGGYYRPMSVHRMRAAVGADGGIRAWDHRIACQSLMKGTSMEPYMANGIDASTIEGARALPYAIDNVHVDVRYPETGVPVLWWRSVGHSFNAYATEVFFDRLATQAGRDPYELRVELLKDHPRHLRVLKLAAEKAAWGKSLPAGRAQGIAVHESFGTLVAQVAEVSVQDDGRFRVESVTCAVDCGIAINPDIVRAQMEGGIGYGLSAMLREGVTLTDGVVDQGNFDRYQSLRIDEMPSIDVHIVESTEAPSGVGEPGTPPVAPAVANAIARATKRWITRLPVADQLVG